MLLARFGRWLPYHKLYVEVYLAVPLFGTAVTAGSVDISSGWLIHANAIFFKCLFYGGIV